MEEKLINIIPEGVEEVFHASKGDNNVVKRLKLTEKLNGTELLCVHYRKSNDAIGSFIVPSTSGLYVDVAIPSAMTDVVGFVYCKLRIDGIGAKAFLLNIEMGA